MEGEKKISREQLSFVTIDAEISNLRALLDEAMAERNRLHNAWLRARDKVHQLRYAYRLAKERERRQVKAQASLVPVLDSSDTAQ